MSFRALFGRVFGRKGSTPFALAPLVPGFTVDQRLEGIVRELAQNASKAIGERLYGDGEDGEPFKKAKAVCDSLVERHGAELKAYLKPYIDLNAHWAKVPSAEWHRWFAAGVIKSGKQKVS